jgi:hypothetical protein
MQRNDEVSTIRDRFMAHVVVDWEDDSTTVVEPFLLTVRKMDAPPSDDAEDLETVRGELHERVDQLVDRALESAHELRTLTVRSERAQTALREELEFVVRHSNALVKATAPAPRRSRTGTVIGFPIRAVG